MIASWLVIVPLLLFEILGGVRTAPRASLLVFETAAGATVIALGAMALALHRGRSMLGRSTAWLLGVAFVTPLLLMVWKITVSSSTPNMMVQWSERPGLRCMGLSFALSLVPLVGVIWMRRNSDPTHPHLAAAGLGAGIGAATWVLVDLWCPVGYVPHLLLGHVAPLVFITVVSALAGGRILAVRGRRSGPFAAA